MNEFAKIEKYDSSENSKNNMKSFNNGGKKETEEGYEEESSFTLVLIVVVASFGIVGIIAGLSINFLKNRKEKREKKKNLYVDS